MRFTSLWLHAIRRRYLCTLPYLYLCAYLYLWLHLCPPAAQSLRGHDLHAHQIKICTYNKYATVLSFSPRLTVSLSLSLRLSLSWCARIRNQESGLLPFKRSFRSACHSCREFYLCPVNAMGHKRQSAVQAETSYSHRFKFSVCLASSYFALHNSFYDFIAFTHIAMRCNAMRCRCRCPTDLWMRRLDEPFPSFPFPLCP